MKQQKKTARTTAVTEATITGTAATTHLTAQDGKK